MMMLVAMSPLDLRVTSTLGTNILGGAKGKRSEQERERERERERGREREREEDGPARKNERERQRHLRSHLGKEEEKHV